MHIGFYQYSVRSTYVASELQPFLSSKNGLGHPVLWFYHAYTVTSGTYSVFCNLLGYNQYSKVSTHTSHLLPKYILVTYYCVVVEKARKKLLEKSNDAISMLIHKFLKPI